MPIKARRLLQQQATGPEHSGKIMTSANRTTWAEEIVWRKWLFPSLNMLFGAFERNHKVYLYDSTMPKGYFEDAAEPFLTRASSCSTEIIDESFGLQILGRASQ